MTIILFIDGILCGVILSKPIIGIIETSDDDIVQVFIDDYY